MMWVILSVIVLSALVGVVFVNMPQFGRLPRGERLARIERSAHYRDGEFRNLHETVLMTSGKGFFQARQILKKFDGLFIQETSRTKAG